jgi:NADH-quinone oxidoreductase subunit F
MKLTCEKNTFITDTAEIIAKDEAICTVDWSKSMFDYARRESCGKCVLCREGTMQIYSIIRDITESKGEAEDLALLTELSHIMERNAGCEQARKVAKNLLVAIEMYQDEWEMHIKRKRCPALVCRNYISYHILPENCQGCMLCSNSCGKGAIAGSEGLIHVIDQEKCSRCGECTKVCSYDALQKAGAIKPKTPEFPIPVGSFESGSGRRRRRG